MARRRFFVDRIEGGEAIISGEDAHHLARVLRAQAGQLYEISDNRAAYLAEVTEVHERRVTLRVREPLAAAAPVSQVRLFAALIKFDRFEWLVEKATELGVSAIVPVEAERCERGLAAAETRVERWRKIAREASQQSRRVRMPAVERPVSFEAAIAAAEGARLCLDEEGGVALADALEGGHVSLAVGPEGGWTEAERRRFREAGWHAVWLGPGILRAETAAMAAVSVIAHLGWVRSGGAQSRPGGER